MTLAKLLRKEGEKFTHYNPSVTRFLTTLKRCLFCQIPAQNFPAVTTHVSTGQRMGSHVSNYSLQLINVMEQQIEEDDQSPLTPDKSSYMLQIPKALASRVNNLPEYSFQTVYQADLSPHSSTETQLSTLDQLSMPRFFPPARKE